jgi:glycosyltransferase involved in cell wall biosynthesis
MREKNKPANILITSAGRVVSVELGAILPLTELQRNGLCNISYVDLMRLTMQHILWCDILFICRGVCPLSVWAAKWAKKFDRLVIGYWDDYLYDVPEYSTVHRYHSNPIMRKNNKFLFQIYDAFFTPSTRLASKLSSMHPLKISILPGALNREMNAIDLTSQDTIPVIGCIASLDHVHVLNSILRPVIADMSQSDISVVFHIIGPKIETDEGSIRLIHTPFIPKYSDYSAYVSKLRWDVGLAPQIINEFTNYKYYNKLLEYAYIGCAGIYSSLGIYRDVIVDGVTGLLSENDADSWRDNILKLINSPKLRLDIINNSRAFVRENNSLEVVVERYAQALKPFLDHRATHNKAFISAPVVFSGWLDRIAKTIMYVYIVTRSVGIRRLISSILGRISKALRLGQSPSTRPA